MPRKTEDDEDYGGSLLSPRERGRKEEGWADDECSWKNSLEYLEPCTAQELIAKVYELDSACYKAAFVLADYPGEKVAKALLSLLPRPEPKQKPTSGVFQEAGIEEIVSAYALGHQKEKRAVDHLVAGLSSGDYRMVAVSAWALGEIGEERAVAPLKEALQHDEHETLWISGMPLLTGGCYSGNGDLHDIFEDIQEDIMEGTDRDVSPIIVALRKLGFDTQE